MKSREIDLWEKFDPAVYVKDNYAEIHDEDRKIIEILVRFYERLPQLNHNIEIGGGPNLYPLMLALLCVRNIEVVDISARNLTYLRQQLQHPARNWYLFWDLLRDLSPLYKNIDLVETLNKKVAVKRGNIFQLPSNKYDLASMFSVAESITDKLEEFKFACNKFINSVKSDGFLVAMFMENSDGYTISGINFPSVSVNSALLENIFQPKTKNFNIYRIPKAEKALRLGYTGMLLFTGQKV